MMSTVRFNPGPGSYEPKATVNDKGSYFVSKFKNSMAGLIDPPTSKRFKSPSVAVLNPGPGHYNSNL